MRKRLRKKKHVGEFRQFGCLLVCFCIDSVTEDQFSLLQNRWLDEVCVKRGFERTFAAWVPEVLEMFVCRTRGSISAEDRSVVETWAASHPEIAEHIHVTSIDAYHDPFFSKHADEIAEDTSEPNYVSLNEKNCKASLMFLKCMMRAMVLQMEERDHGNPNQPNPDTVTPEEG